MREIWRDIDGYEGMYQVSNLGNVKSKERRVVNHKSGATRIIYEMVMTPWDNGNGYLVVTLSDKHKRKNHYVHRLVAEAFLDREENKRYINHLDYNKYNNNVANLEWCTQLENVLYSSEHMKKPRSKSRPTNTGEKYISKRLNHGKHICYRVCIKRKGIDKSFKSLEEALYFRNEVM